jgi:predicted MFS family arabinose efflux permease
VLVYAFVIFFGLMQGARGPIIVAMVAQLFRGGVGAVYGTLSIAQGVGAGLGSWGSGLLYEVTGSYITSFMVAIGGAVIGMASFWVVRSLREERVASPIATAPTA